MTNTQLQILMKSELTTKPGGAVYKCFYEGRHYRHKEGGEALHSNRTICDEIGIDIGELDEMQQRVLGVKLSKMWKLLYNSALERGQYFGTIEILMTTGDTEYFHGYTLDPAKAAVMRQFRQSQARCVYRKDVLDEKVYDVTRKESANEPQHELIKDRSFE